jgi:hypothetical protein
MSLDTQCKVGGGYIYLREVGALSRRGKGEGVSL